MNHMYKIQNLNKSFSDKNILSDINFEINKGDMVSISGESGSGKSTLLNIMGLLDKASSGKIYFMGKDITKFTMSQRKLILREKIAYLFQNFALIDNETISQNLDICLIYSKLSKKEKESLKKEALKNVGIELPLKSKIFTLSGGEQQRVALARILLKNYEVILADEPTGSLDTNTRNDIIDFLKELNKQGKTIIIVTHDDYVSSQCNKRLKLVNGNLQEEISIAK